MTRDTGMLEMTDIHVGYGRATVVHGASVEVSLGGVAAVMGHNGAARRPCCGSRSGYSVPPPGGSCWMATTSPGCDPTSGSSPV